MASKRVLETNVVPRAWPFQFTVEEARNCVPETVIMIAGLPAVAELGLIWEVVGTAAGTAVTKNLLEPDLPPPGVGLATRTRNVPVDIRSLAGIDADKTVLLINSVERSESFHCTFELAINPVPLSNSVKEDEFTAAVLGLILVSVASGFLPESTENKLEPERPPPGTGFSTRTRNVPVEIKSLEGIAAISTVLLTKIVGLFASFHSTAEPGRKLDPVSVIVKEDDPTVAVLGFMDKSVGSGLSIRKSCGFEIPPGPGLNTVTMAVPVETRSAEVIFVSKTVLLR